MARPKTKVTSNERRSIISKYTNHGYGLVELSELFEYSVTVIRRVLVEANATIRGRGRPKLAV